MKMKLFIPLLVVSGTMLTTAMAAISSPEKDLKAIVFNSDYSMEQRWDAYHKVVRTNKTESLPMARKALKSNDWFLREAGLKTIVALKPIEAVDIARKLFQNDPSLLVRAQALSAIKILDDKDSEKILWKALDDKKNFRGDQSLWIRPKIVATLMEFKMGQKEQFKKLVDDRDPQIQRLAQIALDKTR